MTAHDTTMQMLMNAMARRLSVMFPGYFPEAKHNHYGDFGWPENVQFEQFYGMYRRNSVAKAAVKKTARKTWETHPVLRYQPEDGDEETPIETAIRQHFTRLRVWQKLTEADRRGMVGAYSGVILRFADSQSFDQPVDRVPGGLDGLVGVIPAWEGQLHVAEWDEDPMSESYGEPRLWQFNEAQVSSSPKGQNRAFNIHPDRVIIWSETGDVHSASMLESGYNDLLSIEKVTGAGGEGFWKNAKGAPILEMDKEARLAEMAKAMGVDEEKIVEAMNEQVEAFNKGFDKTLLLQGMKANAMAITLPNPEHFYIGPLQSFAASVEIPVKILVGMQTGERASQEDADEWARTCMGRRQDWVVPSIMEFVNRLERVGVLPEQDWRIQWDDLTEADMPEKIDRADKMAGINQKSGDEVYTSEEIRAVTGHSPIDPSDVDDRDDDLDDEE